MQILSSPLNATGFLFHRCCSSLSFYLLTGGLFDVVFALLVKQKKLRSLNVFFLLLFFSSAPFSKRWMCQRWFSASALFTCCDFLIPSKTFEGKNLHIWLVWMCFFLRHSVKTSGLSFERASERMSMWGWGWRWRGGVHCECVIGWGLLMNSNSSRCDLSLSSSLLHNRRFHISFKAPNSLLYFLILN